MGEIPIFTSEAHVFVIDPATKKSWIPSSRSAISVNFFFDSSRQSYRIISVEGSKAIINSTITPLMSFTKTSAKFGQWADIRANTIYGLGFSSDVLLNKFADQFDDVRERSKNVDKEAIPETTNNGHVVASNEIEESDKSEDVILTQYVDNEVASSDDEHSSNSHGKHKLQMENEKLKSSLSQSSANIKKLETELEALKNTNTRLTSALQESMANIDQWHRQLNVYKENNDNLKKKINDLEIEKSKRLNLGIECDDLKKKIEILQKENTEKSQECSMLQQRIGVLTVVEKQHHECASRIKIAYDESNQLKEKSSKMEESMMVMSQKRNKRQTDAQQYLAQIATHLTHITEVTQKIQSTL